jgi:hypothetical protein
LLDHSCSSSAAADNPAADPRPRPRRSAQTLGIEPDIGAGKPIRILIRTDKQKQVPNRPPHLLSAPMRAICFPVGPEPSVKFSATFAYRFDDPLAAVQENDTYGGRRQSRWISETPAALPCLARRARPMLLRQIAFEGDKSYFSYFNPALLLDAKSCRHI